LATTESKDDDNGDATSDSDAPPDKAEAKAMWHFLWGFTKPEIPLVAFACLGAVIHGLSIDAGFLVLGLTIEVVAGGYTQKPFQCSVTAENALGNFTDSFDCLLSSTCKANIACWGCTHNANGSYTAVSDCTATDCTDPYGAGCSFDQFQPAEEDDLNPLILAYVVIFVTLFIGKYIQNSSELVSGENMIGKLRVHSFDVFIRKSAAWQDHYRTSDMTEALAVSCADSSKLTVLRWPKIMNILAILIGAIAVAFAYCWRLAAVTISVLPLLIASQASDMASQLGLDKDDVGSSKEMAEKVAQDAAVIIEHLRDIVALGRSRDLVDRYKDALAKLDVVICKQTPMAGFTAFMSQMIMFCQWALAFWYGGTQIMDGNCDFGEMNIAFICILFSGFQAGQEVAFIPDDKAATVTMVKLHKMLTFQTEDDQRLAPGMNGGITVAKGEIVFKDVEFAYPTRKSAKVLDKLNLTIEAGKTVALVGQSGCGKSTVISLIQKLYSIDGGSITIDGQDINGASGDILRSQIAVVPQEPKLFNTSIADNIAYRPQEHPVLQEQIERCAKVANADGFIAELSDGYRYTVGKFGEKLSGGQRQRVAIARSVFSDSDVKILLLDEATSALDNENEKLVQTALGTAAVGRTTVIVAHRLSTIKNADKICVFDAGQVAEQGTFAELMAKNGAFASYYRDSAIA
jgi:ATP-binding cassette subfamily B (MDR/TAP) protein 1